MDGWNGPAYVLRGEGFTPFGADAKKGVRRDGRGTLTQTACGAFCIKINVFGTWTMEISENERRVWLEHARYSCTPIIGSLIQTGSALGKFGKLKGEFGYDMFPITLRYSTIHLQLQLF